jgi:membrane-associated protease RseP (regulator of RpoE activity)
MRGKALRVVAVAALVGSVALASTSRAQEKTDETDRRVRVLRVSEGSYLGVFIADVTAEDASRLGLREEHGVLITGVADEGPAREAGFQEDDVILSWNGDRIESQAQLRRILNETPPGRTAAVGVYRSGSERSVDVTLGESGAPRVLSFNTGWDHERSEEMRKHLHESREHMKDLNVRIRAMPQIMTLMSMRGGRMGVAIQNLGPQLAEYFGLGDRTGVLITSVNEESPAATAGLRAGDVIVAIDGEDIEGPGDVSRMVWAAEAGPVAVGILRDRSELTVTVDLPEHDNSWTSEDGEVHGFFFGPEDFDVDEVHVEFAEPFEMHFDEGNFMRLDEMPSFEFHMPRIEVGPHGAEVIEVPHMPMAPIRIDRRMRALSI